ncbi:NAD(P)/FAD-dependent oxidoreductase [Fimbriiglobus ruber]|uniref:D-amino acid dehydrogenase small subunit n=1 Tax=Fimbriiglobus ruber TaxID=1908690 RepID=A0A225D3K0_9BACT|nr:FAD-dependent oxidoreductase [Fimbriiglobus ruber]OWK36171.1 D-amino acid dehydrogenase small subunit [Fimbriiglobus ruber]
MSSNDDVVVIGGGVVGTACAYYLAKAGRRVTLLDRGRFGAACSHGNCGYVCPSHVLPLAAPGALWSTLKTMLRRNSPLKVRPGAVLSNLGWFLGFARKCNERDMLAAAVGIQALLNSSRALYDELLAAESIDCEWDTHGLLFVFHTKGAFDHYAEVDHLLRDKFHLPAERYDADGLLALEPALKPGAAAGGYLYKSDAQVRPDRLMTGWRAVLTRVGVTVRENCELTGFVREGSTAKAATTTQGDVPAADFVVATGAWTPLLNDHLGCRVPIVPGKGYSLTMPRPSVCPTYPMIFEEHRVAVSPFKSGYRIGSTMEFAGYDAVLNRARLGLLRDGAGVYLREPESEPVQEEWCGWRPMVYDGKPVIDRSPALSNVMIAAGHGMLGLSMAPGTGKLVTELLTGDKPHVDPTAYGLKRFG